MLDFSIIIPVYNAEDTLKKCLNSIEKQSFQNYEVILVDDGSTDQSFSICKEYETRNKKFCVSHQDNSGPSVARNLGLEMAKGRWICFVDSDDCIEENYLQEISVAIKKHNPDIIFMGYTKIYADGREEVCVPGDAKNTKEQTILELSDRDMFGYTWIKVFQADVINNNRFDSTLNLFEDEVFTCQVIKGCNKIAMVKKPIYRYKVDSVSSLIGRVHEDYCVKCDKVYCEWKNLLANCNDMDNIMAEKANKFVSRCYYYAFERAVDIQKYFSQLRKTSFFQEHTDNNKFDYAVKTKRYRKLGFEKRKYQLKVKISLILHRKGRKR